MEMRDLITIIESSGTGIPAIHRTSRAGAVVIRSHGFDLQQFGTGAGAGSGEPAGVFVSIGDGDDFSVENNKRKLSLDVVLHLRLHVTNILRWDNSAERLAYTKKARLEFLETHFKLSTEEATAIVRYSIRVLDKRPDLEKIADWLDTRPGELEQCLFLNQKLQNEGYDAVEYRDPWHGVEQMIVLDPSKIEILNDPC